MAKTKAHNRKQGNNEQEKQQGNNEQEKQQDNNEQEKQQGNNEQEKQQGNNEQEKPEAHSSSVATDSSKSTKSVSSVTRREQRELIPEDAVMYDVGWGQKLALRCSGQGAPTVILEPPAGVNSDIWTDVVSFVNRRTRVCVYDRGGVGFSDRPVSKPPSAPDESDAAQGKRSQAFTAERMADDLHRLVTEVSSQPQPFVMVGAEIGALVSRFYTHMFDSQVTALVLIDPPTSELFEDQTWSHYWHSHNMIVHQARQMSAAVGLTRLSLLVGFYSLPEFWSNVRQDENVTARQKSLLCHPKHLKTAVDELDGVLDSLYQIKVLGKLKPFPSNITTTVIRRAAYSSKLDGKLNEVWRSAKDSLVKSLQLADQQTTFKLTQADSVEELLTGASNTIIKQTIQSEIEKWKRRKNSKSMR